MDCTVASNIYNLLRVIGSFTVGGEWLVDQSKDQWID